MGKGFINKKMGRLYRIFIIAGTIFFLGGIFTPVKSDETLNKVLESAPFPPGENAKLAKEVCSYCHFAQMVTMKVYDEQTARKDYEKMVGDPDTEQGKKIIKYLSTVLGDKLSNSR